jgi:hypothetical protein
MTERSLWCSVSDSEIGDYLDSGMLLERFNFKCTIKLDLSPSFMAAAWRKNSYGIFSVDSSVEVARLKSTIWSLNPSRLFSESYKSHEQILFRLKMIKRFTKNRYYEYLGACPKVAGYRFTQGRAEVAFYDDHLKTAWI